MNPRTAKRLAWTIWAVFVVVSVASLVFAVLARNIDQVSWPLSIGVAAHVAGLIPGTLGAVVAARVPANPVGWILLVGTAAIGPAALAENYAGYALFAASGDLPAGTTAAWVSAWAYLPSFFAMNALLLLLFPTGRLPGRRWRAVAWLVVLSTAAATVGAALVPVLEDTFAGIASPLPSSATTTAAEPLRDLIWLAVALGLLLAAAAMIVRLRGSRGVERAQLKWIASAAVLFSLTSLAGVVVWAGGDGITSSFLIYFSSLLIPLAAGYAVLQHRLYGIDVVIKRALVYGGLTAVLAATYVGSILVLGLALGPLTHESDLAVALSTLAVAALFQPARRRVQGVVDRRFYRRRYDAALTLEGFGARLRAETDLDALQRDLASVVRETMQPAHVSLWLRETGR